MTRFRLLAVECATVLLLSWSLPAFAADPAHAYVGADKCKMCHNSPAKGTQFTKWAESKHSKAYQTLASEESKKIATAKGIADPQKAPECLRCHVTGHGSPAAKRTDKYKIEEGISCEACHGPGGDYWQMAVMKDLAKAEAAGLVLPNESTCKTCHNADGPTFKGFDYKAMLVQVAHPNPQKGTSK